MKRTKMTKLDTCWKNCLSMWAWIVKQIKLHPKISVEDLKQKWLLDHDFPPLVNNCFFCKYASTHKTEYSAPNSGCKTCPGSKIDPKFDCFDENYAFDDRPIAFYNKLVSLNRKRVKDRK